MEGTALIGQGLAGFTNTFFTSAESSEVLRGLGSVAKELELDSASGLIINGDVKENFGVCSCHSFSIY